MMFSKRISLLLTLSAVTVFSSAVSAQAEVQNSVDASTGSALSVESVESVPQATDAGLDQAEVSNSDRIAIDTAKTPAPEDNAAVSSVQPDAPDNAGEVAQTEESDRATAVSATTNKTIEAAPVPGTIATSAAILKVEPSTLSQLEIAPQETTPKAKDSKVAQTDIIPGRATRSGSSYIGVGGNIGLGGGSALGDGSFSVMSKIGLTRTISVRPAAMIGDDTVFLIPVTYDFSLRQPDPFEPARFAPYIGAGVAFSTGDDSDIGFLLSGGVDVPLTANFTATGAVNAAFKDNTDVGLVIGIGYNFQGF